jgi:hypothetical protein
MNEVMSPLAFKWFVTILTGSVAFTWFVYDAIKLLRLRTADQKDPVVRDKIFGYGMGIIIGALGVLGCLRFHDVM